MKESATVLLSARKRTFSCLVLASTSLLVWFGPVVLASAEDRTPTISSTYPDLVPSGGTSTVTLNGSNFLPGSVVVVGKVTVIPTYKSSTQLLVDIHVVEGPQPNLTLEVQSPGSGGIASNRLELAVSSPVSATASTRILDQTTFGPTLDLVEHVKKEGLNAWLAEQYNTPATVLPLVPSKPVTGLPPYCETAGYCYHTFWWNAALDGKDQFRQRVAFSLSQIFVISMGSITSQALPPYSNMLANDAFTNWYKIMKDVTLSGGMGTYLNMVNSGKPAPGQIANENYARENLQLFNIGLYLLNQDGTPKLDSAGKTIPAYSESQVEAFARAYTGWTYSNYGQSDLPAFVDWFYFNNNPMAAVESEHDQDEKILLNGTVLPAGQTAEQDLDGALTNIFHHPNVPPFVSRMLIQHLVTGRPSPEYVARVANVFADNGHGVRGDMKSVLSAILNDPDARRGDSNVPSNDAGHLLEPVLWASHLLRAVGYTNTDPGGYYVHLWRALRTVGEAEFNAPSVFNFYPPNYVIPGTDLNEPEFDLETTGTIGLRRSLADSLLTNQVKGIQIDLDTTSPLVKLADDPAKLVDTLGILFAHAQMDPNIRGAVIDAVQSVSDPRQRARLAIYLISTSSEYKIEH